jgi:5' nucleotidase, deoxy (Pyrimidine), cytosolic type C protein (NT5C)
MNTNTLYLDMDGVVADWDQAAADFIGKPRKPNPEDPDGEGRWAHEDWLKIRDNQRFFSTLPLMPLSQELVQLARKLRDTRGYQLLFLTAIPRDNDCPWAFYDKIMWVQKYFPDIPVHFGPYSEDKRDHCWPGDILVDDRSTNIAQWINAGGIGIRVKDRDVAAAIAELRTYL